MGRSNPTFFSRQFHHLSAARTCRHYRGQCDGALDSGANFHLGTTWLVVTYCDGAIHSLHWRQSSRTASFAAGRTVEDDTGISRPGS
jgi:hypothetical protein